MTLIDGWRQAWRLWSVRVSALGSLLSAFFMAWPDVAMSVWNGLPAEIRAALPDRVEMIVPLALFALVTVTRVLKQEKPVAKSDE